MCCSQPAQQQTTRKEHRLRLSSYQCVHRSAFSAAKNHLPHVTLAGLSRTCMTTDVLCDNVACGSSQCVVICDVGELFGVDYPYSQTGKVFCMSVLEPTRLQKRNSSFRTCRWMRGSSKCLMMSTTSLSTSSSRHFVTLPRCRLLHRLLSCQLSLQQHWSWNKVTSKSTNLSLKLLRSVH